MPGSIPEEAEEAAKNVIKLTPGRGLEHHWLLTKLFDMDENGNLSKPVALKCSREWDMNASLVPGRPDMNPVAPLGGQAEIGFNDMHRSKSRRNSARCRQPDRSVSVLATSVFGPEVIESENSLTVNFHIKSENKFLKSIVLEYVRYQTVNMLEKGEPNPEENGAPIMGDSARRDLFYSNLLASKPLLHRFVFEPLIRRGEFGGKHIEALRQLQREGTLPEAQNIGDHTFVSLPKVAPAKFVRQPLGGETTRLASDNNQSSMLPPVPPLQRTDSNSSGVKRIHVQKHPFTNYQKVRKMENERQLNSHRPSDPYKSPWQKQQEEFVESKKRWIGGRDFRVVPCKANPPIRDMPNYINLSPWEGDPNSYFADMCRKDKELPKTQWVNSRGMKFNFSVKSPPPKDERTRGPSLRQRLPYLHQVR